MRLDTKPVPHGITEEVTRGLRIAGLRTSRRDRELAPLGGAPPTRTAVPHEVFVAMRRDLEGHWLESAKRVGLRYFGVTSDAEPRPLFLIQIGLEPSGEVRRFSQVVRGPQVLNAWRALDIAAALRTQEAAIVRALEIPDLYFAAMWLHYSEELLIPLEDSGTLEALKVYTAEQVRSALLEMPQGRPSGGLAPDDSPLEA